MRTLILNADFSPHDIWSWKKSIIKTFQGRLQVLENYDRVIRDGSGNEYKVPAVILLFSYYSHNTGTAPYSKRNIHIRDEYICQYCSKQLFPGSKDLTVDHVIPKNKWTNNKGYGLNSFKNVVTCCNKCNLFKGNKTLEQAKMSLIKEPKNILMKDVYKKKLIGGKIPNVWHKYLEKL